MNRALQFIASPVLWLVMLAIGGAGLVTAGVAIVAGLGAGFIVAGAFLLAAASFIRKGLS